MAKKKRGGSGKRVAKRVTESAPTPREERASVDVTPEPEKSKMPERIQEKDSGFGAIKIIVGVIVVLILGGGIFARYTGHDDQERGDKTPGDKCNSTTECAKGSICYAYKGEARRCFTRCSDDESPCEPGYTCTSTSSGRKNKNVRRICVEDSLTR